MKKSGNTRIAIASTTLLALASALATARADYTENLLAGWTFNNGNLTSDLGSIAAPVTFSERNLSGDSANNTLTFDTITGTASIGPGKELYTTAINSTDHPELLAAVTIWVRVRFDGTLTNNGIFGLLKDPAPKSSAEGVNNYSAAMGIGVPANRDIVFSAHGTAEGQDLYAFGRGSGHPTLPEAGGYVDLAFRVQDLGNTNSAYAEYLNGVSNGGTWGGTAYDLQSFAAFALGRIKMDGGNAMTFDEVRIYAAYLTDEQLKAITPITPIVVPETASWTLMTSLAALTAAALSRAQRNNR
ncbi:MAG: hypothetical protein LBK99_19420 [Opitutaceae bacterium]|jgi:hypothetical protein|nr:hypothetical protein [Opitutaceae bacterium]